MKRFHPAAFAALATTVVLLGPSPGRAAAGITIYFDGGSHVLSGTTPGGAGPWAEAVFTRLGDHEVQVDFKVPTNSVTGLYLDDVAFQFNAATAPSFAYVGGAKANSTSFNSAGIAVPGTGNEEFNTDFDFFNAASKRVAFGKDSIYDITFSPGSPILATDLSNLFKTPDASGDGYFAAAHLAGYDGKSAGIAGHLASVPEPSSLLTLCVGMSGLASAYALRRRRTGRRDSQLADALDHAIPRRT